MALSIAALVTGILSSMAIVGGSLAYLTHNKQQRRKWAAHTWRNIKLRNGVTGQSPFHQSTNSFNTPGMVEVFPQSQNYQLPIHRWEREGIPDRPPQPTSDSHSEAIPAVLTGESPDDELPSTPLELSDPPDPAERARCRRLYAQGLSQTKTINRVWGLSKGGSRRYSEARRRFREHVRDIARPDLEISLEAEESQTNA